MKGELGVWDLEESEYVVRNFQGQAAYEALKKQEEELGIEGRASPVPAGDSDEDDSDENEEVYRGAMNEEDMEDVEDFEDGQEDDDE